MNDTAKTILANKLGNLHVANAELAAENVMLHARIKDLERELQQQSAAQGSLAFRDQPSNPYSPPETTNGHAN